MLTLHWIDLAVLVGYFAIMIGVGVVAARRVRSTDDYYMGGRRFGRTMMIMYAFGVGTHADSAVGLIAQTYKLGMAGLWYQWSQLFNTPIYWLLSPVFRRARCLTTADIYELRYGPTLGILYGFWGVAINIGYLGVTLFGSGRLIESLTDSKISLPVAVFLMTAVFLFYSLIGGLIATVWNEFVQGVLTIVMSVLLIPFLWFAVRGLNGVRASLGQDLDSVFQLVAPGEIGYFWIIAVSLNQVVGFASQPHILSNNAAGRTELDNRIGFCAGVTLKRVCSVGWALIGVLAIAYYGRGTMDPDHVFGMLIRDVLPIGFAGLMIACIMASVMDNGAVFVLTTSALFTRNLLRVFRQNDNQKLEIGVGRIFSVVYVVASIALALSFRDVPAAIRFIWGLTPMIGIAFWLGLWWRRANRYGAWASFIAATTAWVIGQQVFGWTTNRTMPHLITLFLTSGVLTGVIVSLLTPSEPAERLDRFYLTINTPIDQESRLEEFERQAAVT